MCTDWIQAATRLVDRVADWVFRSRFGVFVAVCLIYAVLRNGLWVYPGFPGMRLAASNPFVNPFEAEPMAQFILYSLLPHLIGHYLGVYSSRVLFAAFHVLLIVGGLILVMLAARKAHGDRAARWLGASYALLPVSLVTLSWIGGYDALTFLLSTALVLASHPLATLLFGCLLGLNHFEQGIVAIGALSVFQLTLGSRTRTAVAAQLAGVLLGKALVVAWFALWGIRLSTDRLGYAAAVGLAKILVNSLLNIQVFVFSAFSVLWPAVVLAIFWLWQVHPRAGRISGALLLGLAVPATIGTDSSRIYAMVSWPVVLALLLHVMTKVDATAEQAKFKERILAASLLAGVLVPPFLVWGRVYSSTLLFDVAVLLDGALGTHFVLGGENWFYLPYSQR